MSAIEIKPDDSAIDVYYARLDTLKKQIGVTTEGSTRRAFAGLLDDTSSARKWTLVEEQTKRRKGHNIRLDGVMVGKGSLPRGYWEAKDESDDLQAEILKKKAKDYPVGNIIFEDTQRAVLIQDGVEVEDVAVTERGDLARLLTRFYNYEMAPFEEFDKAVEWFADVIPDIGRDLKGKIEQSHKSNKQFEAEFQEFMELCRQSLNPNISKEAVDEMLIQHLLTERLIRNIFQRDFIRRNVIASKVEDVIDALTRPLFDRSEFQESLDTFYQVIEQAAAQLAEDYQAKQAFINTVYEQFFQGYSVKVADTHGIVYTPQEIVDFMCAAVEEVLETEFGKKLGQEGVAVLDPCVGTGNFIINLLNRVNPRFRREFYKKHLFANEVMLMPYYIASLNIENEYYQLEGEYQPFEGLAFVDTLDLAKKKQLSFDFMTEKNSARVKRQQETDITVIIGNPPYNMGQLNENDNNKNREYEVIDQRVKETYAKASNATLSRALYDAYVKFFRWATDRLGSKDGVVCYVTNNSFIDQKAFDGMREYLLDEFNLIYHIDLHGNVRKNPKISGTTHNVFGIQTGVGITVAIRSNNYKSNKLLYYRVPDMWRKETKLSFLKQRIDNDSRCLDKIEWESITPDRKNRWILLENTKEYEQFVPVATKVDRDSDNNNPKTIFKTYGLGVTTARDAIVYDFDYENLHSRITTLVNDYNSEVDRFVRAGNPKNIDDFVDYEKVKWSRNLKRDLRRHNYTDFSLDKMRSVSYRPFTKKVLFFDDILNDERGFAHLIYPSKTNENDNKVICVTNHSQIPFVVQLVENIPDAAIGGRAGQGLPFYVYDEDGSNRRENITDWALGEFRGQYGDDSISKWDIFYYVYGLLHHDGYRERYADNLKRELPRIPFVPPHPPTPSPTRGEGEQVADGVDGGKSGFWFFSEAGKQLAEIHLGYEDYAEYGGLAWEINADMKPDYRVEKMRPRGKRDAEDGNYKVYDRLKYNDYLTLTGIPEKAFAYRLGNRSAIDWIVDQYRVKTDKRSGIVSDPNGYSDDDQYILKLFARVVQVSLDTVAIVERLNGVDFR